MEINLIKIGTKELNKCFNDPLYKTAYVLKCDKNLPALHNLGLNVFDFITPVKFNIPELELIETRKSERFTWMQHEIILKDNNKEITCTLYKCVDKQGKESSEKIIF